MSKESSPRSPLQGLLLFGADEDEEWTIWQLIIFIRGGRDTGRVAAILVEKSIVVFSTPLGLADNQERQDNIINFPPGTSTESETSNNCTDEERGRKCEIKCTLSFVLIRQASVRIPLETSRKETIDFSIGKRRVIRSTTHSLGSDLLMLVLRWWRVSIKGANSHTWDCTPCLVTTSCCYRSLMRYWCNATEDCRRRHRHDQKEQQNRY